MAPLTSCVTLASYLPFLGLGFLIYQMGLMIEPAEGGSREEEMRVCV